MLATVYYDVLVLVSESLWQEAAAVAQWLGGQPLEGAGMGWDGKGGQPALLVASGPTPVLLWD